jgi:hypothetical protein
VTEVAPAAGIVRVTSVTLNPAVTAENLNAPEVIVWLSLTIANTGDVASTEAVRVADP